MPTNTCTYYAYFHRVAGALRRNVRQSTTSYLESDQSLAQPQSSEQRAEIVYAPAVVLNVLPTRASSTDIMHACQGDTLVSRRVSHDLPLGFSFSVAIRSRPVSPARLAAGIIEEGEEKVCDLLPTLELCESLPRNDYVGAGFQGL